MVASQIVVSQFPVSVGKRSCHAPTITCTKSGWSWKLCRFIKTPNLKSVFRDHAPFSGEFNCVVPKNGIGVVFPDMETTPCVELLSGWDDDYNGVVIDPKRLPSTANAFASMLRASLAYWKLKVFIFN